MGSNASTPADFKRKVIYPPKTVSEEIQKLPEWVQLGCGDSEYICREKGANFSAVNIPDSLPNLGYHNSYLADVLKQKPALYAELKDKKTKLGVNLGHCIKTGIDNPSHPFVKTCGIVAGDEESYALFAQLFDPIIEGRHGGYKSDAQHPSDMNP